MGVALILERDAGLEPEASCDFAGGDGIAVLDLGEDFRLTDRQVGIPGLDFDDAVRPVGELSGRKCEVSTLRSFPPLARRA